MSATSERRTYEPQQGEWSEAWMVARSHVDPRVWVPLEHDSDMSGVHLAGGIRAVRRALAQRHEGERLRWRRVNDGLYEVDVWVPGPDSAPDGRSRYGAGVSMSPTEEGRDA